LFIPLSSQFYPAIHTLFTLYNDVGVKKYFDSFDTRLLRALALSQSSKTFVIRSFFFEKWLLTHVFGGSRGQKSSCKQACIGFLTF